MLAVSGPGTAFDSLKTNNLQNLDADVILLIVATMPADIHWMEPQDFQVSALLACTGQLGDCVQRVLPESIPVLFADGEVWFLSPDTPASAVAPFFTIEGAINASREVLLSDYRCFLMESVECVK